MTPAKIESVFTNFNKPIRLFELSFDKYNLPNNIKTEENLLTGKAKTIHLLHPYQSTKTTQIDILIPWRLNQLDFIKFLIYRMSIADSRFGLLPHELRTEKGLIYDFAMFYNFYAKSIQISYSCPKNKVNESLKIIDSSLERYKNFLSKKFDNIIQRLILSYKLDWANINNAALYYIEEALLGEVHISPQERINKILSLNLEDIFPFHDNFQHLYQQKSIKVLLDYADKEKPSFS